MGRGEGSPPYDPRYEIYYWEGESNASITINGMGKRKEVKCITAAVIRIVSKDQTKFPKTCYFGKKTLATLSKKTTKLSNAKHCTFGEFLEIFGKFLIITPSDYIQTPHSSRSGPTARRRSPWRKCWRRKDSRTSPCHSEVGSPSSPAKFAWENRGGCCL